MKSNATSIKNNHLPIGTHVIIHRIAKTSRSGDMKIFHTIPVGAFGGQNPNERSGISGVIVGGTYLYEGELQYEDEGEFLIPQGILISSSRFVYLVRGGFTNRPIKVLPEDLAVDKSVKYWKGISATGIPFRKVRGY
jgi:hypothetical protein